MNPEPETNRQIASELELSPEKLVAEHTGRLPTSWQDGRWVSLSRNRLGPEEPTP